MNTIAFLRRLFQRKPAPCRFDAYRIGPDRHPNIAPWMETAFADLAHVSQHGGPFALAPCVVNGEPSAVIVTYQRHGQKDRMSPLFVAVTNGMDLTIPGADRVTRPEG